MRQINYDRLNSPCGSPIRNCVQPVQPFLCDVKNASADRQFIITERFSSHFYKETRDSYV